MFVFLSTPPPPALLTDRKVVNGTELQLWDLDRRVVIGSVKYSNATDGKSLPLPKTLLLPCRFRGLVALVLPADTPAEMYRAVAPTQTGLFPFDVTQQLVGQQLVFRTAAEVAAKSKSWRTWRRGVYQTAVPPLASELTVNDTAQMAWWPVVPRLGFRSSAEAVDDVLRLPLARAAHAPLHHAAALDEAHGQLYMLESPLMRVLDSHFVYGRALV